MIKRKRSRKKNKDMVQKSYSSKTLSLEKKETPSPIKISLIPKSPKKKLNYKNTKNLKSTAQENILNLQNYQYNKPFEFTEKEIKEAFDTLDIYKKNFITSDELSLFLEILNINAEDEEITEMIRMAAKDGINKVYYRDFLLMAKGENLSPIGVAFPPSINLLENKNIKFENMQRNQFSDLKNNKFDIYDLRNDNQKKIKKNLFINQNEKNLLKNNKNFKIERVKELKELFQYLLFDSDKFKFFFDKLKKFSNSKKIYDHSKFSEFFEFEDKKKAKMFFFALLWPSCKFLDLKELLINYIALQDYSITNKSYLSFFIMDDQDKESISFQNLVDIISFLSLDSKNIQKEKLLRKIYKKMTLNSDNYINLMIYEKIVKNFQKVLFPS